MSEWLPQSAKDWISVGFVAICLGALLAFYQNGNAALVNILARHNAIASDFVAQPDTGLVWGPSSPGWGQRTVSHIPAITSNELDRH